MGQGRRRQGGLRPTSREAIPERRHTYRCRQKEANEMYGLPRNIDLTFFDHRALIQVCFGAHDLILRFDEGISVLVTSSVGYTASSGDARVFITVHEAASALFSLLNHSIVSAKGDERGTLVIMFDDGGTVFIYDDSKQFESYVITNGEQVIVV